MTKPITLTIDGPLYFRIVVILAIIGVIGMTAFMTMAAVIYNLISDLVGGVEVTVLEETYNVGAGQPAPPQRRSPWLPTPAPQPNGADSEQPRQPVSTG